MTSGFATRLYLSPTTVVRALEALVSVPVRRTGRAAILGYLILKARETAPGNDIYLTALGDNSARNELDRFFNVASGSLPYVNPFGKREGRIERLASGYERRGIYTHLYPGRTLSRFLDVDKVGDAVSVRVPADAAVQIAARMGTRLPLYQTAVFLMRSEEFSTNTTDAELLSRFRAIFSLDDRELSTLFVATPFAVAFDASPVRESDFDRILGKNDPHAHLADFGRALTSGTRRHSLRDLVRQRGETPLLREVLRELLIAAGYDAVQSEVEESPARTSHLTARVEVTGKRVRKPAVPGEPKPDDEPPMLQMMAQRGE